MKTGVTHAGEPIGTRRSEGRFGDALTKTLVDRLSRLIQARRARVLRAQKLRERRETWRIMSHQPYDVRADVGWPSRYDGSDDE